MGEKKPTFYLRLKGENADTKNVIIIIVFYIIATRKPQGQRKCFMKALTEAWQQLEDSTEVCQKTQLKAPLILTSAALSMMFIR